MASPAAQLRRLPARPGLLLMPCCFDALSAKLIEQAGFPLTFMSGFAVAASRLALPDTGLISYGEMLSQGRDICAGVTIPVIGDGDTGYGKAMICLKQGRHPENLMPFEEVKDLLGFPEYFAEEQQYAVTSDR